MGGSIWPPPPPSLDVRGLNISLINGEKYLKSQNLSKHGVENGVAMATCYTLDAKFQNVVLQ